MANLGPDTIGQKVHGTQRREHLPESSRWISLDFKFSKLRLVVPQFGIAKLVQTSPISLGFIELYLYLMEVIYQLITGGYHLEHTL